ncbi:TfoX/Sxy family protein [Ancylobacter sp. A5.8]|uniref:TfoX/Sxy family protein n=1 Tax=Ancylobacter gelatini TaxID=2919920 RepID=UPI001F4D43B1|nr:TfoX/Sxy family protein [Ancylobacter gelatini]MCJ8143249.1 TfoX/Sxy family protein [Ancylobacter gelatini]
MDAAAIEDAFAAFGPVRVRAMFGGSGIYADGLMIAICVDGQIYLKADPALAQSLREAGGHAFTYEKQGKPVTMGFWSLPESALDDGDELASLAARALSVARAAAVARTVPRRRGRPGNPRGE